MNDTQLLTRLAEANAYGKEAPPPETIWTSELALREIERRMGMKPTESPDQPTVTSSQQQQEAAPPPSAPDQVIAALPQRRRQGGRGPLVAIAAAVVVVLAIGAAAGILTLSGDGGDDVVAASPTTSGPITSFDDIPGRIYLSQGIGRGEYMYFLDDRTMNISTNPDLVVDRASDVYTTRFDGTHVLITMNSSRCPQPDQGGTYEIHLLENGNSSSMPSTRTRAPCDQASSKEDSRPFRRSGLWRVSRSPGSPRLDVLRRSMGGPHMCGSMVRTRASPIRHSTRAKAVTARAHNTHHAHGIPSPQQ